MFKDLSAGMQIAFVIILLIFAYFGGITFVKEPNINLNQADKISSYLQSILTFLIGYYWGTSSKRETPASILDIEAKRVAAKIEEKRIEAAKQDIINEENARIKTAEETGEDVIKEATITMQRGEPDVLVEAVKEGCVINVPDKEEPK